MSWLLRLSSPYRTLRGVKIYLGTELELELTTRRPDQPQSTSKDKVLDTMLSFFFVTLSWILHNYVVASKNNSFCKAGFCLSNPHMFISRGMLFREETMFNMYFLHNPILAPLRSWFGQLNRGSLKNWFVRSNPGIFISREMPFREETLFNMYFLRKPLLGPLKSCLTN